VFIDTPYSGNIRFNSVVAYTASRFEQASLEDDTLGHGLFTYALIEGLDGKAANDKREITTRGLAAYVKKRVEELARTKKVQQEPQFFPGGDDADYVLAHW
jgi:uncharacterized caspase-like protein